MSTDVDSVQPCQQDDWIFEFKRLGKNKKSFYDIPLSLAKQKLFRFVLMYRVFIWLLQFLFNIWDFSTDAFKGNISILDRTVLRVFQGFHRWDAIHFVHIAEYGYAIENSLAFFPLLPVILRQLASPLSIILNFQVSCILVGSLLNMGLFCASARLLYFVVKAVTHSDKQATIAVILFAVNPASVFFSAIYTESVYSFLTFAGIALMLCSESYFFLRFTLASTVFALGYLTRSNGIMNIGYLWFYSVLEFLFVVVIKPKGDYELVKKTFIFKKGRLLTGFYIFLCTLLLTLAMVYIWLPLHVYSEHQRTRFCTEDNLKQVPIHLKKLALRSEVALIGAVDELTWCNEPFGLLPPFYKTIQLKYWNVGFLKYWMFSKLHCFLLASPTLFLIVYGVYQMFIELFHDGLLKTLAEQNGSFIPYTMHSLFIGLSAVFMFNTEVVTRMIFSSTPFPYLILAKWMDSRTPRAKLSDIVHPDFLPFLSYFSWKGIPEFLVYLFFLSYSILGTTMHSMFLPFT
ncbi:unnamed protein product [Auanema sp. JU1783]|nr:unnamed protein product [Auanema sp. JU1783]